MDGAASLHYDAEGWRKCGDAEIPMDDDRRDA